MTNEEAVNELIRAFDVLDHSRHMDNRRKEAFNKAYVALKAEPCEDCVSREAVKNGLASIAKTKAKSDAQKSMMGRAIFFVEQLPPVTPKPTECEDAVSREFMYKLGARCIAVRDENGVLVALTSIESLPPVTPQPKMGHWVGIDQEPNEVWECDRCGFVIDASGCIDPVEYRDMYKYCPNCGARIGGESE